jgi:glycosyltransferase involved in cell wall biosynthesis
MSSPAETYATPRLDVAIVHDYLNQRGGAERVVLELARMWPEAPIFTSLYRRKSTYPEFQDYEIRSTFLDLLPIDTAFRKLAPLYPLAFESFGTISAGLIISSSSGWAHRVAISSDAFHAVYCHSPPQWLFRSRRTPRKPQMAVWPPFSRRLRKADRAAARRADLYIANAHNVRDRILVAYGIVAEVVHPPVDVDRLKPTPRGDRLLVVSRLLPYKRIDLAIRAANRASLPLDVVGTGPELDALRELAGPTVEFHGALDDDDVRKLMENCRAVCVPGVEDFGIVAVEANAAGKPVVGFAAGGTLETMSDGETAALFAEPSEDLVLDAIRRADELQTTPEEYAANARRFGRDVFAANIQRVLSPHLARRGLLAAAYDDSVTK